MFDIKQFVFNHIQVNTYLLIDPKSLDCAIIDPGMSDDKEAHKFEQYIDQHNLHPRLLLVTHPHIDHIAGLKWCIERYALTPIMHKEAEQMLKESRIYAAAFGFGSLDLSDVEPQYIDEGACLSLADNEIEARYVPGHCAGSLCFVVPANKMVFTGDALFYRSIGRTDLPGGNYDLLREKINTRLFSLNDDYQVLSGHGNVTTIGEERRENPFL